MTRRFVQALVAGVLTLWGANLVEGLVESQNRIPRDPGDWLHSFLLYGWCGLVAGAVWGALLAVVDRARGRRRPLFPLLLVPGLVALAAFVIGGYWLNQSRHMPPFWTLEGKIWTLAFGVVILLACALVVAVLARRPYRVPAAGAGAAWTIAAVAGFALVIAPPLYSFARRDGVSLSRDADRRGVTPVVVILVDTLRRDHLQCYGYDKPTSPRIDRLAGESILFESATTTGNMTVPSIATLFTGLYPSEHQVIWAVRDLPGHVPTLAEMFYKAGYRTAAFVGNPVVRPELGFGRGFELFHPEPPPRWIRDRKTAPELLAIRLVHGGMSTHISTLADAAAAWLAENSERPPFVYLHAMEPHSPYDPGRKDAEPFLPPNTTTLYKWPPMIWDHRGDEPWSSWEDIETPPEVPAHEREVMAGLYDGEIRFVDRVIGSFLDRLEAMGLYDDALIVFLADHGEEFQDHGGWFHGLTLYEEMVGMPLLVKLPGGRGGGVRTGMSLDMVDVVPTLCGLAGIGVPASCTGRDLSENVSQLASGQVVGAAATYFVERPPYLYALRLGDWKIVQKTYRDRTTHRLFDLSEDPDELVDLAYTVPDTLARLRALLRDWIGRVTPSGGLAADVEPGEMDPETERMLRNLGYIN